MVGLEIKDTRGAGTQKVNRIAEEALRAGREGAAGMNDFVNRFKTSVGPLAPNLAVDLAVLVLAVVSFLNGMLLAITARKKRWVIDSTLIAVIACFDMLLCVFMACSVATRLIVGTSMLTVRGSWCIASSIIFCGCTIVTLFFTALLSLVRYLVIVRGHRIRNARWTAASLVLLILLWAMFGISGAYSIRYLLPSGLYCTPQFYSNEPMVKLFGYTIFFLLLFSLVVIPACYVGVTLHYRYILSQCEDVNPLQPVTARLTLIVVAYLLAILPETLHVALALTHIVQRTGTSDGIVMTLLFSVTLINALFALLMHEETKRDFLDFFSIKCFGQSSYPSHLPPSQ